VNEKWKKVYGRPFPAARSSAQKSFVEGYSASWDNTEEFIEERYPVDVRENLRIDCEVKMNGFREFLLRHMLARKITLGAKKSLLFEVTEISVAKPYEIYWKVLNRGEIARKRNCVRGQIWKDEGSQQRKETTNFRGDHIVECYCVKDGVVVAKDRIHVPIVAGGDEDER